ncbi:IS5 family transposase [Agrobacterium tumefaciens]|uniref:IS5 family transposase n=1 Tax=Agrobacterium tumefaciens TaxID=358 RepID=UPI0021D1B723|nr:IS5 family transposase [Agrobacterium tumefaciens]UXT19255.1 IS5 family transposase [Agrobacterium tumefaciens]UXT20802.1 IS5 family transposase [Agrobacterium tumefaciens]UXT20829.1 IS5 family transposase [Agrobacterium tumefaciens]UXT22326.1 IS5 family transposase [Agrobacterium tumefaciens]
MSVRDKRQFSFVEALMPPAKGSGRLERLSCVVKWYRFEKLLSRLRDEKSAGRPAYRPLVMFKALLLQSLYGLSDMELEEALGDRLSFKRFIGLTLEEAVPDHSTLCRFRNLLIGEGLLERLFSELDRQLDAAGLILRRGTMLDATIIETTAARPPTGRNGDLDAAAAPADGREQEEDGPAGNDERASDPDARFVRHAGKHGSAYGYKAHVGVDEGSGLIRRVVTTAANVNDTVVADLLIVGDEDCVLADGAYHTHVREKALRARGIKPRLMRRPNRHRRVLPPRLVRLNRLISKRRAGVETTFATLKNRMGLGVIRYRGLIKAKAQVLLAAMAFNMRRWVTLATPTRPHCA